MIFAERINALSSDEVQILLDICTLGMYDVQYADKHKVLDYIVQYKPIPKQDFIECLFHTALRPNSHRDCYNCRNFTLCETQGYFDALRSRIACVRSLFTDVAEFREITL